MTMTENRLVPHKEQNQAIKIVHLTTVHHPLDPRIYYKQCHSLAKAGYDVTLISPALPNGEAITGDVKHIPLQKRSGRVKRMLFSTMELYKKAKALQADIYVFHDPELLFVGRLLKKKDNIVIYDIHEDYVTSITQKDYIQPLIRKMIAKGYTLFEKICSKKMEFSLAEKYYKDIYPEGVCILNYPIAPEVKTLDKTDENKKNGLIYTGNVTEDRGALYHANIPNINKEIEVHLIGKCANALAKAMYAVAGDEQDRLHIQGIDQFIPKADIDAAYMSGNWLAGIAIFPPTDHYMKKELTKFFEYMGYGLPIICSNFPVWEAFIQTYECGIVVDPTDDQAVNKAIHYLQEHPEEAAKMGANGMRAVKEELNWHAEEVKMIQWYERLLKERE